MSTRIVQCQTSLSHLVFGFATYIFKNILNFTHINFILAREFANVETCKQAQQFREHIFHFFKSLASYQNLGKQYHYLARRTAIRSVALCMILALQSSLIIGSPSL
jgi:hypothetical protein